LAPLPHAAEGSRETASRSLGRLAADLQILESLRVAANAQREIAVGGIDVALPNIGRLENVTIGVDRAGIS